MFSDTTSARMGFCRAPTVSLTAPPSRPALPAQTTRAISGTECSVHWALLGESGLLSTSVPLHLHTTIGHQEAPWRPQYYPKGIVGNLALRNKWGFLQKHGHWYARLGHKSGRVKIKSAEYCTPGFPHTHLQSAIILSRSLHKNELPQ